MIRFANEFGLTAVVRSRLAAGVYGRPAPSKFDGLLRLTPTGTITFES